MGDTRIALTRQIQRNYKSPNFSHIWTKPLLNPRLATQVQSTPIYRIEGLGSIMNEIKKLSMQPTQSSLHELLDTDAGTAYHIPLYQRDYKWSDVEVEDFLRDAFESFKNNRQRFFGTVLLSENAPQHDKRTDVPSLYVIDGQQRLTTTLLILTAMRHLAIEIAEIHPEALSLATRLNDRITVEGIGQKREPSRQLLLLIQ